MDVSAFRQLSVSGCVRRRMGLDLCDLDGCKWIFVAGCYQIWVFVPGGRECRLVWMWVGVGGFTRLGMIEFW